MSTHHRKYTEPITPAESKPPVGGTVGRGIPVTIENIRARAYLIFQSRARNQRPGDATSDWLQAERELTGRPAPPTAPAQEHDRSQARGDVLASSIG